MAISVFLLHIGKSKKVGWSVPRERPCTFYRFMSRILPVVTYFKNVLQILFVLSSILSRFEKYEKVELKQKRLN